MTGFLSSDQRQDAFNSPHTSGDSSGHAINNHSYIEESKSVRDISRHTSLKTTLQSLLKAHRDTLIELLKLIKKSTSQNVLSNSIELNLVKTNQNTLLKKLYSLQEEIDFYSKDISKHQELSKKIYEHEIMIEDLSKDTSEMISLLGNVYHDSYNIQRNLSKCKTNENNYISSDEIMKYAEKIAYVIAAPPDFREGETVLAQFKPPYPRPDEWMYSLLYDHNTKKFLQDQSKKFEKENETKSTQEEAIKHPEKFGGMVDTLQLLTQNKMDSQREKIEKIEKAKESEKKISLFGMDDSDDEDDEDEDD